MSTAIGVLLTGGADGLQTDSNFLFADGPRIECAFDEFRKWSCGNANCLSFRSRTKAG